MAYFFFDMRALLLFMVFIAILIVGCSQYITTAPQTQPMQEYCVDKDSNGVCDVAAEVQQQAAECALEGLLCSDAKVTQKKIQFSMKNILDRDITVHSVTFTGSSCEMIYDEKLFKNAEESFIIPCTLYAGSSFNSEFTVKYAMGDAILSKTGVITAVVEREN